MRRKKKNNVVRAYKHLLQNDRDWDFCYLLFLERKKMKRMVKYFSESNIAYYNHLVVRDLNICIRLLDITLDYERATNIWSDEVGSLIEVHFHKIPGEDCYTMESKFKSMIPDYPKYVNTHNWKRFLSEQCSLYPMKKDNVEEEKWRYEHFKEDLRKAKAWHLYNIIREYRLFSWWD